MRKALIIGIDFYEHIKTLNGCVNDAYEVKSVLERHSDGSLNFSVNLKVSSNLQSSVTRKMLKELVMELFRDDSDIALFYFAGHGYIESSGGYLITSEVNDGGEGFSMNDLISIVNSSKAKNKIIMLDCCFSGQLGTFPYDEKLSVLSEGVTILTASAKNQYSMELNSSGVFTSLMVDALNGGASNLLGDITPGSVYAHIDQALGPWEQRPIFKTNVKTFISLRQVQPPISLSDLRKLVEYFPDPSFEFPLNPTFEPTSPTAIQENCEIFSILQNYSHVNLLKPIDEDHMYYAAINCKACKLTSLGIHYWNLIKKDRI